MKRNVLLVVLLLLTATLLFAGCDKVGGNKDFTAPENLQYDGATLTWDAVKDASYYMVTINDGDSWKVTTARYPYNAAGSEFTATVYAVKEGKKKDVESEKTTMDFKPLSTIAEVRVADDGTLSWDVVNSATAYAIRIDGVLHNATVELPTFADVPVGRHSVQVRPIVAGDNSYYSSWSNAVTMEKLDSVAIDNITYDNGYIKWNYISGAQYYRVTVNGIVLQEKCNGTQTLYDPQNMNFEVVVQALGNHSTTYDGNPSQVKKFIFLDTVTDITVSEGKLVWQPVNGATGYKIKLNGVEQSGVLTDCVFDRFAANINTTVQVMPISNDSAYFSSWSVEKSVLILPAPIVRWNADIELDGQPGNNLIWDSVANASGYAVRLTKPDGNVSVGTFGETQRYFSESYLEVGVYTLEVQALAPTGQSNTFDSIFSTPVKVIRLAAPTAAGTNYITSNPSDLDEGFTVTFNKVAGATSYRLFKDSNVAQTIASTSNQFAVKDIALSGVIEEQTYNFKIQSIGKVESINGQTVATLPSLSEQSLSFMITVLASPQNPQMDGYTYRYESVSKAMGYTIDVGGQSFESGETYYELSVLKAGNYRVAVCARGNGSDVLPSAYCAAINVHRLEAPTNVRIETTDASEGVLRFDEVPHAQGYTITFNNDGKALPVNTIENMNQYVTAQGTTVYMQSAANYYNADGTTYYMTSQPGPTSTFLRLNAPTFGDVAFNGNNLVWKAPANMNTAIYTPTYEVYNNNGVIYNGDKNGTSMDLSYLEGGKDYTFLVKAIGDGKTYINSEKSTVISIYKLATPDVKRVNGQYTWAGVSDATSYAVYVDGVLVQTFTHVSGSSYAYTPRFTEHKTYSVEVIAIGDNGYRTLNSKTCSIKQETAQLQTPDFRLSYSEDYVSQSGKVVVTISKETPFAKGYVYVVGGTSHEVLEGDVTTFSYLSNTVGKIVVGVYAKGGNFDDNGIYYLDSQYAGGNDRYSITLLASPNPGGFKYNGEGKVSWDSVKDAVGYEIEVEIDGELVKTNVNGTSYTFSNYQGIKKLTLRVRALGDGSKTVSSTQAEYTWTLGV